MLVVVYLNPSCVQSNCFDSRTINETYCEDNLKYAVALLYNTYLYKIKLLLYFVHILVITPSKIFTKNYIILKFNDLEQTIDIHVLIGNIVCNIIVLEL